MSPAKTKQVLEQRLGKPLNELFAWIDLEAPLGSASIAQVQTAPPQPSLQSSTSNSSAGIIAVVMTS